MFEDPPIHDIHRNLLARAFTPRKINALEPMVREFTQKCLDPLVGGDRFDFVKDLGAVMPLRVVGMLFGIPEDYQRRVQEDGDRHVRTERGGQMTDNPDGTLSDGEVFADSSTGASATPPTISPPNFSTPNSKTRPAPPESCDATNC